MSSGSSGTITDLFAEWVRRCPDAVAVSSGTRRLTYAELDARSNRLAYRLLALGVGVEEPVAVLMRRGIDLVVAILGVVKAGGCYLPLHEAYPPERMQWIMDRCGAPPLLVDSVTARGDLPRGGPVVCVDTDPALAGLPADDPGVAVHPGQLAYVIHTSGSTGHPKGVAITHGDVVALVRDRCWDGDRHRRVLSVAPYAFNVSTYELWVPLLRGGQIVLAPPGNLDVATLRDLIRAERPTAVHLTAGLFRVVADEAPGCLAGVREVLTGGDVIAPTAVRRVLAACPDTVVRAMYGATELTLFSTHSPMTEPGAGANAAAVPVGRPMDGVRTYILDDRLQPVPTGAVGELYIAGRGVARGYYGRPDLTAERFVADPFTADGQRMYRTGDLARRTDTGLIDFVGRANDQVKIMGFRVELGEVEAVLAGCPGVGNVAVVARDTEQGERRLVAYVVPAATGASGACGVDGDSGAEVAGLRAYASSLLPQYMVPSAVVVVDALPLTPNGKVDRRALPEPDFAGGSTYRAPRNPTQETLCAIFAELLEVPRVGIDDSFFALGGQSLLGIRLVGRVRAELNVTLTIAELFDASTVAELDELIATRAGSRLAVSAASPV